MDIKKIAVIGTGSMGSMLSMLLADQGGCQVSIYDPSDVNRERAVNRIRKAGFKSKITAYVDYESLCKSLDKPKVFLLSIPHGTVGDGVLDSLDPYLEQDDIIIDAANEFYLNTQRRQARALNRGVHYIGTGVSGGYQAAREGPSLSPSGDKTGLELVLPLLKSIAARDVNGNPCVAAIGPGGSGHYTKMVHNGIEQGIMSAMCEIWGIMRHGLGMKNEEIAEVFDNWNKDGELRGNFLVAIGADICRTCDPESKKPMLDIIKDKVAQDAEESEGTGYWTCEEAFRLHVPIPTIAAGHAFRLGSADAKKRQANAKAVEPGLAKPAKITLEDRVLVEDLRMALYGATLESFLQGFKLLAKASQTHCWNIDFLKVTGIWRGGCIIRSEFISELFLKVFADADSSTISNPVQSPFIGQELKKIYPSLKKTILIATECDLIVPAASASLEVMKYMTAEEGMPTTFMEAQLDYFGEHMFDLASDGPGEPVSGVNHFGWKAAKDVYEERTITQSK